MSNYMSVVQRNQTRTLKYCQGLPYWFHQRSATRISQFRKPLIDQRELLQVQNQKLKQARDLLLPKLMSGEIAV